MTFMWKSSTHTHISFNQFMVLNTIVISVVLVIVGGLMWLSPIQKKSDDTATIIYDWVMSS